MPVALPAPTLRPVRPVLWTSTRLSTRRRAPVTACVCTGTTKTWRREWPSALVLSARSATTPARPVHWSLPTARYATLLATATSTPLLVSVSAGISSSPTNSSVFPATRTVWPARALSPPTVWPATTPPTSSTTVATPPVRPPTATLLPPPGYASPAPATVSAVPHPLRSARPAHRPTSFLYTTLLPPCALLSVPEGTIRLTKPAMPASRRASTALLCTLALLALICTTLLLIFATHAKAPVWLAAAPQPWIVWPALLTIFCSTDCARNCCVWIPSTCTPRRGVRTVLYLLPILGLVCRLVLSRARTGTYDPTIPVWPVRWSLVTCSTRQPTRARITAGTV